MLVFCVCKCTPPQVSQMFNTFNNTMICWDRRTLRHHSFVKSGTGSRMLSPTARPSLKTVWASPVLKSQSLQVYIETIPSHTHTYTALNIHLCTT